MRKSCHKCFAKVHIRCNICETCGAKLLKRISNLTDVSKRRNRLKLDSAKSATCNQKQHSSKASDLDHHSNSNKSGQKSSNDLECEAELNKATAIQFLDKVKIGPEYVCACCHRMLYRNSVVECVFTQLPKLSPERHK